MASRYGKRIVFTNRSELYENIREEKSVTNIKHFNTPSLRYPTVEQIASLATITHLWKTGDRYYKIAAKYYGDPTYWWVIAWFNQKPTEGHLRAGELLTIPLPLDRILNYYGV